MINHDFNDKFWVLEKHFYIKIGEEMCLEHICKCFYKMASYIHILNLGVFFGKWPYSLNKLLLLLSVTDIQCCINFWYTAKWFSYTCIYISYPFPLWFIMGFWIHFQLLYNRILLLSSLYVIVCICWFQTPNATLPHLLFPLAFTGLFSISVSLFLFHSSFGSYFRFHI